MSDIDVRTANLNLMPALEALLVEGSVTGAARRMHVTQSAMSHSLARLRALLDDPLFVATGRKLVPTARAIAIAASLPRALDSLATALMPPSPFDPKTSTRAFRIATLDYFEFVSLPGLLTYLRKHAPLVRVEIERFGADHIGALASGEIDLALVGEAVRVPKTHIERAALYEDPFRVIVRQGHPVVRRSLSLSTYAALGHVLISIEGRRDGAVDRALEAHGLERRVTLRVPHFAAAPLAVLHSDLICTLASGVAERAKQLYGLRVLSPPLDLPSAGVIALWPRRHADDEGARWFRDIFLRGRTTTPKSARTKLAVR